MERAEFIKAAFEAARRAGLCYNQKQFGDLLGIDRSAVTRALNGEPSEKMVLKIEKILADHGVVIDSNTGIVQTGDNSTAQQEPQLSTADRLLNEMQAQREMYDRHLAEVLRQNSQLIQIITKGA